MNIEVHTFSGKHISFVKPNVTIEQIFDRVATGLGLSHRQYFGLQAYNEQHQAVVWLKPSDSLSVAIKKGVTFKPLVRFYLRAHTFPVDFEPIREDVAAMKLFYGQVAQQFGERGYRADSDVELALASLVLLIELGPKDYAAYENEKLLSLATRILTLPTSSDANSENMLLQAGTVAVQMWSQLGGISPFEAMHNYLSILASVGYEYEKVRFTLKNHLDNKPADLALSFQGVELCQPDAQGHIEHRFWPWTRIRSIAQRAQGLTVQPVDNAHPSIVFRLHSRFEARRVHSLAKAYSTVHNKRDMGKQSVPAARLTLSNPEQFFDRVLRNIVAMNDFYLAQQQQHTSNDQTGETSQAHQLANAVDELGAWIDANETNLERGHLPREAIDQLFGGLSDYQQVNPIQVHEDFVENNPSKTALEQVDGGREINQSDSDDVSKKQIAQNSPEHVMQPETIEVRAELADSNEFGDNVDPEMLQTELKPEALHQLDSITEDKEGLVKSVLGEQETENTLHIEKIRRMIHHLGAI